MNLSSLLHPMPLDTFVAEHWERRPLHLARDERSRYDAILTAEDVDRALSGLAIAASDVRVFRDGRATPAEAYARANGRVDPVRVARELAGGATLVLERMDAYLPGLASLCRAVELETDGTAWPNLYWTPPRARGFSPHRDDHDVFILQIRGTKQWTLFDAPIPPPARAGDDEEGTLVPGKVAMRCLLRPGDLLYVPRGVVHAAKSRAHDSLHVTLGLRLPSFCDLLARMIELATRDDVALRRALPLGYAHRGERASVAARAAAHLGRLRPLAARALDELALSPGTSAPHALVPQLEQVIQSRRIGPASVLGVRPFVRARVERVGDRVQVACRDVVIDLPAHAEAAVRHAVRSRRFTLRDLPGELDDEGKCVLARRLVRDGVLWFPPDAPDLRRATR